jgi:hypothetical protein
MATAEIIDTMRMGNAGKFRRAGPAAPAQPRVQRMGRLKGTLWTINVQENQGIGAG